MRLTPVRPKVDWREDLEEELALRGMELDWLERERARIAPIADRAPRDAARFMAWFEQLEVDGPGQHDPLFTWLADEASLDQMRWFLRQEIAGEVGFADLVALTQLRMPEQPKLALARNFGDETCRPLVSRLTEELDLASVPDSTLWEVRALGNLLCGLAANRRYAYHSLGALGVIELTAPGRTKLVNAGLERLNVAPHARAYFALRGQRSEAWNREILAPLLANDIELAPLIAEGALLRLEAGARCFARYREELDHAMTRAA